MILPGLACLSSPEKHSPMIEVKAEHQSIYFKVDYQHKEFITLSKAFQFESQNVQWQHLHLDAKLLARTIMQSHPYRFNFYFERMLLIAHAKIFERGLLFDQKVTYMHLQFCTGALSYFGRPKHSVQTLGIQLALQIGHSIYIVCL